jgi:hypothetical protein
LLKRIQLNYQTKEYTDIQIVEIPSYIKGEVDLQVIAVDSGGYQDVKSLKLNIVEQDKDKPILYKKKVVNMKDGRYRIYLVFMDKTSYVK